MKLKTTNKQIRANFYKVLSIGYCDAQYLLQYKKPFAYTSGIYGWNADFYEIGNLCLSTGYRPIGDEVNYILLQELEKQARSLCCDCNIDNETRKNKVNELLNELINSVK